MVDWSSGYLQECGIACAVEELQRGRKAFAFSNVECYDIIKRALITGQRGAPICTRLSRLPGLSMDPSTSAYPSIVRVRKAQSSESKLGSPWLERCGAWVHLVPFEQKTGNSRITSALQAYGSFRLRLLLLIARSSRSTHHCSIAISFHDNRPGCRGRQAYLAYRDGRQACAPPLGHRHE